MIALLLSLCLWVNDLERAERAYRLGQFEQALALYQQALPACAGQQGGVLFNMGNCAHRLGRHAEAALFFRRALLRLPGDDAATTNLALAERQLGLDPVQPADASPVDPLPWLLLAALLQGAGLAGSVLLHAPASRRAAAALAILGLGTAARAAWLQWWPALPAAVVLIDAPLRSEPRGEAPALRSCRPGEVVDVVERSSAWVRVAAGATGWIEARTLGAVD